MTWKLHELKLFGTLMQAFITQLWLEARVSLEGPSELHCIDK